MSKIEWTEKTWNPVVGCTKVSPGCQNCYAERMAYRLACMAQVDIRAGRNPGAKVHYIDVIHMVGPNRGKWNGKVKCVPEALEIPLHWRKPRMIFVCSMSDLFHPSVPFEFIDKVVNVLEKCPRHTGQLLTKRAGRLYEYSKHRNFKWPENIIGMVTTENQPMADLRIPYLLQCGFKTTGISIEPMLGEIDFKFHLGLAKNHDDLRGLLNWVIVGGESGPKARYCPVDNIRGVVQQCRMAGVPVFVKQIHMWETFDSRYWENEEWAEINRYNRKYKRVLVKDINRFPMDLRIREYPKGGR